jgi:hypothetical protein
MLAIVHVYIGVFGLPHFTVIIDFHSLALTHTHNVNITHSRLDLSLHISVINAQCLLSSLHAVTLYACQKSLSYIDANSQYSRLIQNAVLEH